MERWSRISAILCGMENVFMIRVLDEVRRSRGIKMEYGMSFGKI